MAVDGNLFGGLIMSRITLAVTIGVVLTRTAAPCCAELFSVEVPDLEGSYHGFSGESHESAFDFGQDFYGYQRGVGARSRFLRYLDRRR